MRGKIYAMLLGFAVFTGATFNLAKYSVHYFSATSAAGWRFGIAAWGAILFMAIFTSVLGYLWWNKGIETIGASNTSLFFNLVPVVTMVLLIITGTPVTLVQILGTLLVILGVLTSTGLMQFKNGEKFVAS